MEKHLFYYTQHSQYVEPTDKPAVSYCEQEDEVHYAAAGSVTLITFTIAGDTYQAEEGMTWQQWTDSSYNVVANPYIGAGTVNNGKWYADLESDMVYRYDPDGSGSYVLQIKYNSSYALPNDLIDAGKSYTAVKVMAPGAYYD